MTEHKAALAVELECKGDAKGDAKSEASSSKRGLSLSKDQIVELFEQRVTRVQKQFQLGFTLTVRLLEHFKFDAERLIAAVDPKHPQDLRGLVEGLQVFSPAQPAEPKETYQCPMCDEVVAWSDVVWTDCGHAHCAGCMLAWIESTMIERPDVVGQLSCLQFKCPGRLPPSVCLRLLPSKQHETFTKCRVKAIVRCFKGMRWCPRLTCGRAFLLHDSGIEGDVSRCECGYQMCSVGKCTVEADHAPADCRDARYFFLIRAAAQAWELKYGRNRSETPCPFCGYVVSTNIQGDRNVTCRQCKETFCLKCGWPERHDSCPGNIRAPAPSTFCDKEAASDRFGAALSAFAKHQADESAVLGLWTETHTLLRIAKIEEKAVAQIEDAFAAVESCHRVLAWRSVWLYALETKPDAPKGESKHRGELAKRTEAVVAAANKLSAFLKGHTLDQLTEAAVLEEIRLLRNAAEDCVGELREWARRN